MEKIHVVIVGGGFAGMGCAQKLAADPSVHITLIDRNNYHEFTPLLYQVATSLLAPSAAASPFRHFFSGNPNIDFKMANVISLDPQSLTVFTEEGASYKGDFLVLAAGSVVNFFNTPGAEKFAFPLYKLIDAEKLRSRILGAFEDADLNPTLIDQGALNFVIVGAGPTGTEVAGAIADMLHFSMPKEFIDLAVGKAQIYLVNHGPTVLGAFSRESQEYAAEVLAKRGVKLIMGQLVEKVTGSGVELSNGQVILTKTVIWAGGLKAPALAAKCSLVQGHGGRIAVRSDLTVEGFPRFYALGDIAIIPGSDGKPLPQLASVAKQAGEWAAKSILAQAAGKKVPQFNYDDKGIMAIIGKDAGIVELGKKRRKLKGFFAYLTWLMVHAALLSSLYQKVQAFVDWMLDYLGRGPAFQLLDRSDATRIDWKNDEQEKP